ncbi:hypothetical protein PHIN9_03110 [Polynucleobacter sp. HIN9]|uniref:DUF268 domain-containing protein n=1 Tax=Polynucleobacter sp. HIN9 TaxID=3047868 RepID=UPI0025729BBD|nr:DUF268 domain-containing protein [Polynucleobacter sp. HIN9]BEI40380.1 hypothetical protein PHIN9_03110 [Polynucleobacter sp. HIN9]
MNNLGKLKFRIILSLRCFGYWVNSLFPFLLPLKNYINGNLFFGVYRYLHDCMIYIFSENKVHSGFKVVFTNSFPIFLDRYDSAGNMPRHYFWQDLWAAEKVYKSKVARHFDIGSRLDGFIAHCLPFCEVVMMDIRPLDISINNLSFLQVDCTNMEEICSDSIFSLSSLHAVEHFGLGRYGDPIDPFGYKKVILEMQRISKLGGDIYLSVPIGYQRLEFNAQRIFDPNTIVNLFDQCELIEFSVIDDANKFHQNARLDDFAYTYYGCGLFHFKKYKLRSIGLI